VLLILKQTDNVGFMDYHANGLGTVITSPHLIKPKNPPGEPAFRGIYIPFVNYGNFETVSEIQVKVLMPVARVEPRVQQCREWANNVNLVWLPTK
jgi:hypothetical protein